MGSWSPLALAIQKSCLAASLALACSGMGIPAAARPWSEVVSSGQLRVAVKDNLRPLGFRDPEGKLQGFEIELARELGSRLLGSREAVELVPVANVERLQAVAAGEVDLAIAQIGITPDRARQVEFTSAYYQDGPSLVVAPPRTGQAGRSYAALALPSCADPALLLTSIATSQGSSWCRWIPIGKGRSCS
jgi:ABC-type amino acid transport substrate-binding protein